jgi:hypothetical protein
LEGRWAEGGKRREGWRKESGGPGAGKRGGGGGGKGGGGGGEGGMEGAVVDVNITKTFAHTHTFFDSDTHGRVPEAGPPSPCASAANGSPCRCVGLVARMFQHVLKHHTFNKGPESRCVCIGGKRTPSRCVGLVARMYHAAFFQTRPPSRATAPDPVPVHRRSRKCAIARIEAFPCNPNLGQEVKCRHRRARLAMLLDLTSANCLISAQH